MLARMDEKLTHNCITTPDMLCRMCKKANFFLFHKIFSGHDWGAADVEVILKLELYDMVDFGKQHDAANNEALNHFQGWLM